MRADPIKHGAGVGKWRRSCPGSYAFTLVELLVVIAIIGVLAAILLPSLASARKSAQRIQCVSNQHQLGLAIRMYWDEHEDTLFRFRGVSTNAGQVFWFGWLENWTGMNEGQRGYDPTFGALYPYLQGRGVDACPSLRRDGSFKWKARGATFGYGYNLHLSAPPSDPPYPVSRMRQPSHTVLMADAAQVNMFQFPATPDNPLLEEFYYVSAHESTTHFRHKAAANALFGDGHVDRETAFPGSVDPNLSSALVGRLREEILLIPRE